LNIGNHSHIAKTGSDISANVTIGNYTSIGPYVQMHTLHQHACIQDRKLVSTAQLKGYPHPYGEEKMVIGSDVWIGRNATLLGSITIGHGAIIGAFSVVAKDIPPYAVVVGNPAIVKRYRFTPTQIESLLSIQWWNWDEEKIENNALDLLDIDLFIQKHLV
jgi:acetyltransferase-like isoleucine patch superfamily enzyme